MYRSSTVHLGRKTQVSSTEIVITAKVSLTHPVSKGRRLNRPHRFDIFTSKNRRWDPVLETSKWPVRNYEWFQTPERRRTRRKEVPWWRRVCRRRTWTFPIGPRDEVRSGRDVRLLNDFSKVPSVSLKVFVVEVGEYKIYSFDSEPLLLDELDLVSCRVHETKR